MEAAAAAEALLVSEEAKMNTLVKELETQLEAIKKEPDMIEDVFNEQKYELIQPIYKETLSGMQSYLETSPIDFIMSPVVEEAEKFEYFDGERNYKGKKYPYTEVYYERYRGESEQGPEVCSGIATLQELLDRYCQSIVRIHITIFDRTKVLRDMGALMKAIDEECNFCYKLRVFIDGQFREFKPELVYRNLRLSWYQYWHEDFEE